MVSFTLIGGIFSYIIFLLCGGGFYFIVDVDPGSNHVHITGVNMISHLVNGSISFCVGAFAGYLISLVLN